MYVCVRCVYIVTTKCKAVRKTHLDEHDDPETISLFYIFIIYYTYFQAPHHQSELLATRKNSHFKKNEPKKILKYDKGLRVCDNGSPIIYYLINNSKLNFDLLYTNSCIKTVILCF